jgi:hypothetical protein
MGWWPGRADGSADGYTRVSGWRGVLVMKRLVVPGLDAFPFSFSFIARSRGSIGVGISRQRQGTPSSCTSCAQLHLRPLQH